MVFIYYTATYNQEEGELVSTNKDLEAVLGESDKEHALFYFSFLTSFFTSSLGITKYLLNGACRVLPRRGFLNGMISCEFLLAYAATICSMTGKIAVTVLYSMIVASLFVYDDSHYDAYDDVSHYDDYDDVYDGAFIYLPFGLIISLIPQLIISTVGIARTTGCRITFFEIMFNHPQTFFLPLISYFAFGPRRIRSHSGVRQVDNDFTISCSKSYQLTFSRKYTVVNMAISTALYSVPMVLFQQLTNEASSSGLYCVLLLIPGIFFTSLFLLLDSGCYCKSNNCCSKRVSSCFKLTYHYVDVDSRDDKTRSETVCFPDRTEEGKVNYVKYINIIRNKFSLCYLAFYNNNMDQIIVFLVRDQFPGLAQTSIEIMRMIQRHV